jgi:hypothetical protein
MIYILSDARDDRVDIIRRCNCGYGIRGLDPRAFQRNAIQSMSLNGSARKMQTKPVERMRVPVNYADQMILMKGECQFHTYPSTTNDDNFHEVLLS